MADQHDPTSTLDLFRLDGLTAIVTGASSGLGDRFARVLHAVGANVVVTARRAERLERLAGDLNGRRPGAASALVVVADVGIEADRERIVSASVEQFGRVDVLVNNAGVGGKVAIEDEDIEVFRRAMEINVTAVWHLAKLSAPSMIESGGGAIINVASMLGHVASSPVKQSHYSASKGAVVNLTRELAVQWARQGIRVNALCPGWFPSEMTEGMDTTRRSRAWARPMNLTERCCSSPARQARS
jgi:NAD(P)-dependent dehydrogenase (short-subunit alcohol dehydrogenase family)